MGKYLIRPEIVKSKILVFVIIDSKRTTMAGVLRHSAFDQH